MNGKAIGWQQPFEEPVPLPRGRQLVTLEDAANYMLKLRKAQPADVFL